VQHSRPPGFALEQFLLRLGLPLGPAAQDTQLAEQQWQLLYVLETAASLPEVQQRIWAFALAHSA
jgi:hypothetical protein